MKCVKRTRKQETLQALLARRQTCCAFAQAAMSKPNIPNMLQGCQILCQCITCATNIEYQMSVAAIGTLNVSKPVRMEFDSIRDMHPEINWWCTAHGAPLNIYGYNVFHSHIEDFVILRSKTSVWWPPRLMMLCMHTHWMSQNSELATPVHLVETKNPCFGQVLPEKHKQKRGRIPGTGPSRQQLM